MPFRSIGEFEALTSDDLNILQEAYDLAVAGIVSLDDAAIHDVVATMIARYRMGTTDKSELADIAGAEIRRRVG